MTVKTYMKNGNIIYETTHSTNFKRYMRYGDVVYETDNYRMILFQNDRLIQVTIRDKGHGRYGNTFYSNFRLEIIDRLLVDILSLISIAELYEVIRNSILRTSYRCRCIPFDLVDDPIIIMNEEGDILWN